MTFRARPHFVLVRVFTILVVLLPGLYVMSRERGTVGFLVGMAVLGVAILLVRSDLAPLVNAKLAVGADTLNWQVGRQVFEIPIAQIRAATIRNDRLGRPVLLLATGRGAAQIPLQFLDHSRIGKLLSQRLAEGSWGEQSFRDWAAQQPEYVASEQADEELIGAMDGVLHVQQRKWVTWVAWVGMILFGVLGTISYASRDLSGAVVCMGFFLLSGANAFAERIEFDAAGITRFAPPFGTYRMRWDEIHVVEHSPMYEWMVLHGVGKRMGLMGPAYWAGPEVRSALAYFQAQVRNRQISVRSHWTVQFKVLSRNTRLPREQ